MALVTNTTPPEDSEQPPSTSTASQPLIPSQQNLDSQPCNSQGEERNDGGITIISRFPNSKDVNDAQGRSVNNPTANANLNRPPTSSSCILNPRLLPGYHKTTSNNPFYGLPESSNCHLSRLANVVKAATSSSPADSTSSKGANVNSSQDSKSNSDSLSPSEDMDIQCNAITSTSDDEAETPEKNNKPVVKQRKRLMKGSLSRELSNLKLNSPGIKNTLTPSHSRRRRSRSGEDSDAENEDQDLNRRTPRQLRSAKKAGPPIPAKRPSAALQCKRLNAQIKEMDKKVTKKAGQLNERVKEIKNSLADASGSKERNMLRSGVTKPLSTSSLNEPVRALRPRTPAKAGSGGEKKLEMTPLSSRKRKLTQSLSQGSIQSQQPVAKSPRSSSRNVISKPVVTRSRTARVLNLKK